MNNLSYSDDFEYLLKEEAEKAESMSILHNKAYQKFSKLSISLNIPVIVISSVVGFITPLSLFDHQNIFLGSMSIGVAILKTIDNYFDISKRCETHRLVSKAYGRFSKWLQLQLSLERECRVSARDLFDIISNEMENIREAEPIIPDDIISDFNNKYKDERTAKPAITNGLTQITINRKNLQLKNPNLFNFDRLSSESVNIPAISIDTSLKSPQPRPPDSESIQINIEKIDKNDK